MIPDPLMSHLSLMARTLPPATVVQIGAAIRRGGLEDGTLPNVAVTAETRGLLEQLLVDWSRSGVGAEDVAVALESANVAVCDERDQRSVEVVWTGPKSKAVPVRRIDQVLYQLIKNARNRLLIVSYAVYRVPLVLKAVNEAVGRGVRVDMVLEFEGHDGDQEWDPLKALGKLDSSVRVYEWPLEKRPPAEAGYRGMIHAKCAVADSTIAMVSSANLTEYALDLNMELGLLVKGADVPGLIESHFRELMNEGVLELRTIR